MNRILPVFIAALVLSFGNAADADTFVQTETVSAANSFSEMLGVGTAFELVDDEFFSLTANPFDPALGDLVSFTVSFDSISVTGSGVLLENFGNASAALSGPFTVAGVVFDGAGTSDFQPGVDAGDSIEFGVSVDLSQTFFVADVGLQFGDPALLGTAFDPAIFAAVTGSDPFEVRFNSSGVVNLNSTEADAEASGTISIAYHFDPAAVPEPSSAALAMFGVLAMAARRRRS